MKLYLLHISVDIPSNQHLLYFVVVIVILANFFRKYRLPISKWQNTYMVLIILFFKNSLTESFDYLKILKINCYSNMNKFYN